MNRAHADFPLQRLIRLVSERVIKTDINGHIHKVEITRKNRLLFELELGGSKRWYEWIDDEPYEIKESKDKEIPLANHLSKSSFAAATRTLSYRPKRRLTLLDQSGNKPVIRKGFRRGQLDKMIHNYETAHEAFSGRGISAPNIIEYDYEDECLVMVYEEGERLRLSSDSADIFHLVGEALRAFQDHRPENKGFGLDDEMEVIDKRSKRLLKASGELPDGWKELRKRLEESSEQIPESAYGLAHRDLHDKQFVQHTNYLTLLDFDLMTCADTALDPANFLAHLVLRNLQEAQGATQRSIDICGKKFLQGLDRNEEPGFWERLRYYQATSFCRLALVYELRPRWQHLVPALVTMGNRCLDDLHRIQRR